MQNFWCAARSMARREAYAIEYLKRAGFEIYCPRLRQRRLLRGRHVDTCPPLFPGYIFVLIILQWHEARWCPGVLDIIMDGAHPARVPDQTIDEIRSRERNGLVELPKPPGLVRGDKVRITAGAFTHHLAIYQGQSGRDRVDVLLQLLGGRQRTELPASAVEPVLS
jgi:transcriptional antiterminator RfaH